MKRLLLLMGATFRCIYSNRGPTSKINLFLCICREDNERARGAVRCYLFWTRDTVKLFRFNGFNEGSISRTAGGKELTL